jgi:hypothetical protein
MQKTHFWYQFSVLRQKAGVIALLFIFSALQAEAQFISRRGNNRYSENVSTKLGRGKDRLTRPLHFGFQLALTSAGTNARVSNSYIDGAGTNGLINIEPKRALGFIIGGYSSIRLGEFWDARILVNVFSAYERKVDYVYQDKPTESKIIESAMIELPVLLKYRAQIRGISGMYLIAGIKPAFALSQKSQDKENLVLKGNDLSIEYGIGLDTFFPYFRFAPELRFSHGIFNALKQDNDNFYSRQLRRLNTHSATLYFHFGG